ncbi:MAG: hypothetical protein JWQ11_2748 [Rhizobacter sp.]|nr:hypothetical protein [Rhizobacter sp.]
MSDTIGSPEEGLNEAFVAPALRERLLREHSDASPGIPFAWILSYRAASALRNFAWILSYRAASALRNIGYFENGVRHCALDFPIRIYLSSWSAAILVTFVPLEAVKEPHIQEWFDSFYEVPVAEAKRRMTAFPDFPYDGRNPDSALAQAIVSGERDAVLKRSRERLLKLGVPLLQANDPR